MMSFCVSETTPAVFDHFLLDLAVELVHEPAITVPLVKRIFNITA